MDGFAHATSRDDETEGVLRSEDGVLGARFSAETGAAMVAGHKSANLMTYNGRYPDRRRMSDRVIAFS